MYCRQVCQCCTVSRALQAGCELRMLSNHLLSCAYAERAAAHSLPATLCRALTMKCQTTRLEGDSFLPLRLNLAQAGCVAFCYCLRPSQTFLEPRANLSMTASETQEVMHRPTACMAGKGVCKAHALPFPAHAHTSCRTAQDVCKTCSNPNLPDIQVSWQQNVSNSNPPECWGLTWGPSSQRTACTPSF